MVSGSIVPLFQRYKFSYMAKEESTIHIKKYLAKCLMNGS